MTDNWKVEGTGKVELIEKWTEKIKNKKKLFRIANEIA